MWKAVVVAVGLLVWCVGPVPAAEVETQDAGMPEEMSYAVTGAFVHYASDDQEITLRDDNGEELIMAVEPGVQLEIDGQPAAFDELQADDRLTLMVVVDDELGVEYVTAIQVARAVAAP